MEEKRTTAFGHFSGGDLHPVLLIREVLRKFWAIVLAAIIFACCGYVLRDATYQPIYRTSTTLVVMQGGSTSVYGNRSAANTLANNLSKLLNGEMLRRTIAEELGVDKVDGEISAETIPESNLVVVTVSSSSPRMAFSILRAAMDHYNDLGTRSLGKISVAVLYPASAPLAPINYPGSKQFAKRAALVGALLMTAAIAAFAYLRDTVKSEKEVEEKLDTRLLTVVHHERKAKTLRERMSKEKKSLLITSPTTGFLYVETIKKLRARVEYQMKRSGAKVIMITSVGENEGKSTIATNLALAMSRKYKNVLLIDGDMKKPALHKILSYQDEDYNTFSELLRGECTLQLLGVGGHGVRAGGVSLRVARRLAGSVPIAAVGGLGVLGGTSGPLRGGTRDFGLERLMRFAVVLDDQLDIVAEGQRGARQLSTSSRRGRADDPSVRH